MKEILLEICTPSKSFYSGMIKDIIVPGSVGNFQVLYNHAPIISSLEVGQVKVKEQDGTELKFSTSGGTIEVSENRILILAETFESPENIDTERAKRSMQRAKDRLASKNNPEIDRVRAEASLKRAINRIKIAELKK